MRDKFLLTMLTVLVVLGVASFYSPDGAAALLVTLIPTLIGLAVFRRHADDKDFVTKLFLAGLLVRLGFGIVIHYMNLRAFFGGDALTYDYRGSLLLAQWTGTAQLDKISSLLISTSSPGWGINYLVATIYFFVGKNILAAQSFCAVVGAAIGPMVYFCGKKVYHNSRTAKTAAVLAAFFPAFIIWSSQLLKDGLIIFLLVLAMTMVLQLHEKFSYWALILLFGSLGGILALRFYIFYMVAIAVAGSFVVGISNTPQSLLRRAAALVILGLGLTYFGVIRNASVTFEEFGNLDRIQISRLDLARSADSGFSEEVDVSTASGAISAIPVGLAYLMLAPFPWEATSLRQAITLPEVFVWWAMMPFLFWGIWWTIKNKLRSAFPILLFSIMLTLGYSIFLGNVGTAYRQRTQIQVFMFIFIAVGWQLYKERKEDKRLIEHERGKQFRQAVRGV